MSSRDSIQPVDVTFNSLLSHILDHGHLKDDRTGTGTLSTWGTQSRYDLRNGKIPLITSRKIHHRSFIHETLWFLSGSTDIEYLKANNVSIWDSWVKSGTERASPMSTAEIRKVLTEHFKAASKLEVVSTAAEEDKTVIAPSTEDSVVTLQLHLTSAHYDEWTCWQQAYRDVVGEEPVKLTGGSIGTGAYGSQWRAWDDTRVIPATEANLYFERGFDYIGEVAHSDMAVVQRKIDQIANVVDLLLHNPDSRRILVVAYNPSRVEDCVLPPCHSLFQFGTRLLTTQERLDYVFSRSEQYEDAIGLIRQIKAWHGNSDNGKIKAILNGSNVPKRALNCHLFQRSNDLPVGGAFNIAQYGLLTQMVAHVTNMLAEELVWSVSDQHIYLDQIPAVEEQLNRSFFHDTVQVVLNPKVTNIDNFRFKDISIANYEHGPVLKYPVAI